MGDTLEFDSENMSLKEFLITRDIPQEIILKIEDEKINSTTILLMPEDDLKIFFPKYGDRVAITNFCRRNSNSQKQSLIQKLKTKIGGNPYSKKDTKNDRKKSTRVVEIGWLWFNKKENRYRQIRTKYGGGTRKVTVDKNFKCKELIEKGKSLFFPNGASTKGNLSSYNYELLDFKSHKVDLDLTVQEMYDISSLSTLRFYFASSLKEGQEDVDEEDMFMASTSTAHSSDYLAQPSTSAQVQQFDLEFIAESDNNFLNAPLRRSARLRETSPLTNLLTNFNEDSFQTFELSENDYVLENSNFTDSQEPTATPQAAYISEETKTLLLHRSNIFDDMLKAFEGNYFDEGSLKIEMILPNGTTEIAEDFGGVLRDALSEFWSTFYEKCTNGTTLKVPFLRHDFGKIQWNSIAKIFLRGYEMEKYMPIKIAPVFLKRCFNLPIEESELLENFFLFICESDREMLKNALDNFDTVETEDLLDFFTSLDSKWLPSKENVKKLTLDIAHKEIIQKSAFIIQCFSEKFESRPSLQHSEVLDTYTLLLPNVKNCLEKIIMVECDTTNDNNIRVFGYLKKFIKEADEKNRCAFFRFCTGSDLPLKCISVTFVEVEGLKRTPISHTCTGLLQLPTSYENFVSFRSEMNNLLSSNIWIMDII